jgi:21S rRNA (GM2251-2'-O)-methyltransferase
MYNKHILIIGSFLTMIQGFCLSNGILKINYRLFRLSKQYSTRGTDDLNSSWIKTTDGEQVTKNIPRFENPKLSSKYSVRSQSSNYRRRIDVNHPRELGEEKSSYYGNKSHKRMDTSFGGNSMNYRRFDNFEEKKEPAYGYYSGDHIFGISPVRLALISKKREIQELLIQEGLDPANKKDQKAASDILELCKSLNVTIREFPKHDLNMLTDSRPHQGFVLRASSREFIPLDFLESCDTFKLVTDVFDFIYTLLFCQLYISTLVCRCVLVLDEVWDPQNFGALLRTSHYLGCDKVVVCAKNSAPLSPVVSKASSGSLEVMDIYSTNNLMKFIDKSQEKGWQVILFIIYIHLNTILFYWHLYNLRRWLEHH